MLTDSTPGKRHPKGTHTGSVSPYR